MGVGLNTDSSALNRWSEDFLKGIYLQTHLLLLLLTLGADIGWNTWLSLLLSRGHVSLDVSESVSELSPE